MPLATKIEFNNFGGRVKFIAGPMILGVWLALALTGRRRSPTWIDRLGVFVGIGVVILYLYHELYLFVHPLFLYFR